MAGQFEVASRLDAPADAVWARVTTAAGVNDELMPIVRMTVPRGLGDLNIDTVSNGTTLGRSWILLLGVIPIDWDRIHIERLEPGRAFHERSTMLSQRSWSHSRTVDPAGQDACTVTDEIRFEPRLPFLTPLLTPLFRWVFGHRHRRLRRAFGGRALR